MLALPQVLLGNLQFGHLGGLLHLVEDRSVRLAGLEVERAVFRLQDDVVAELSVESGKLAHGLHHAVLALVLGTVDEGTPHHDTAERLQRVGQHVGSVGMTAPVVERARLSFRVGLHEEAAKVGNQLVDFLCLALPPALHVAVERVGGLCSAESLGRTEVHRQIDLDAPGAQQVGNRLYL